MKKIRLNHKRSLLRGGIVFFLFIPLGLCFFSCDQDSIFYDISQEVKPKDPYIPGSPTKIVESSGNILYVSNGKSLYRYDGSEWLRIDKPSGTITDLAAVQNSLYCITDNAGLYHYTGGPWEPVPIGGYAYLQNIYGTDSKLYICGSNTGKDANIYTIVSCSGTTISSPLKSGSGEGFHLKGAVTAGGTDYIATTGGVFNAAAPNTAISGSTGYTIMGMIRLPDRSTIAVSTKNGSILHGNGGSFIAGSFGLAFDRAMAIYQTASGTYLLLVGVYTRGYVELELRSNGSWPEVSSYHYPGDGAYGRNTTVHDGAQYRSSLGIQSLTSLYQYPRQGQEGELFASTQQKGVWAYQIRSEGWQWNAY
ncbi:MAG: hypothetical protein LBG08_03645 [Spirochaetaceae bacterium]|jgi:hypothetical protein|nr:hypothetical protein [Spirochaetaceae bacterium]